jgi:hypothetical protein
MKRFGIGLFLVLTLIFFAGLMSYAVAPGTGETGGTTVVDDSVEATTVADDVGTTIENEDATTLERNEATTLKDREATTLMDGEKAKLVKEAIRDRKELRYEKDIEDIEELKARLRERIQAMEEGLDELDEDVAQRYKDQNRVRIAVHALQDMRPLLEGEGIGRNVSDIARDFNSSAMNMERFEEQIHSRSRLMRFLFGGDDESAGELDGYIETNRERLTKLRGLAELVDDEELKALLQEQIQNMEQEQNRLEELAKDEMARNGLLGWLFK